MGGRGSVARPERPNAAPNQNLTVWRPQPYHPRFVALGEERLRSILESLLIISPEPVPVARLVEVIRIEDPLTEEESIKEAIVALLGRYGDPDRPIARGFRIEEVAGGLQVRTVAENAQYVRRILSAKPQKLSKGALETLAIIAYRQPVTKPEIEGIRGVDVGGAIKNLLDRDFVKILGKRDEVGRPIVYGTTKAFLEFFGLRSLAELPTLREYHELDEEHQRAVDRVGKPSVTELAEAAAFLVEREQDPDLEALDRAVQEVDRARKAAEEVLNPKAPGPDDGALEGLDGSAAKGAQEAPPPESEAAPQTSGAAELQPQPAPADAGEVGEASERRDAPEEAS